MKLVIIDGCVGAQGRCHDKGDIVDTQNDDPRSDKLAHDLVRANRALALKLYRHTPNGSIETGDNPEATKWIQEFRGKQAEAAAVAAAAEEAGEESPAPKAKAKK